MRYEVKNNQVYDKKLRKYVSVESVVKMLNKYEESEWNKFVNSGW